MEYAERIDISEVSGWREANEDEVCLKLERCRSISHFFKNYVKGSFKWSDRCPGIRTTLFCPIEPEWENGLIVDVRGHVYGAAIFWPYNDFSVLFSALKTDGIIEWQNKPKLMFGISEELYGPLEDAIRSLGMNIELTYTLPTYFMTAEKARNLVVNKQEDVRIGTLNKNHASMVNSAWRSARQESVKLAEDMISINHSLGIFTAKDSKLVSWILEAYYGLGFLHTVPEYRSKGYGTILVKALSKEIGQEELDVIAMVREKNFSAHNLFKKVGFEAIGILKVIQTCESSSK